MKGIAKAERFPQGGFTRLTSADGRSEDFSMIYGGLSFPYEETPGLLLIGGLVHDTEYIKILSEKEFQTISECAALIDELKPIYQLRYLYHQEGSENEAFAASLKNRISSISIEPAKHTENISSFAISLINDYLATNQMSAPKRGVLVKQLQSDWASNPSERTLHGIVALFCLLSGVNFASHLFDPVDLEAGLL